MPKQSKKKAAAQKMANDKKADRMEKKRIKKEIHRKRDYESSAERKFADELLQDGFRIEYIDGDGNCLFRSLSDQLYGDDKKHIEVRDAIMNYIAANDEHFSLFIEDDESFDDYVNRLRCPGEWGGHQELYAASQVLCVDIHVHQLDGPTFLLPSPAKSRTELHLSYHGEYHYNSLKRIDKQAAISLPHVELPQANNSGPVTSNTSLAVSGAKQEYVYTQVLQVTPWATPQDIRTALDLCSYDFDSTVEMLVANPRPGELAGAYSKRPSGDIAEVIENCSEQDNLCTNQIKTATEDRNEYRDKRVKSVKKLSKKEKRLLKKGKDVNLPVKDKHLASSQYNDTDASNVIVL